MLIHPIEPVFDQNARVLVLGSFPSVKSREAGFYYGHPQNRFWKVLAGLYHEPVPQTTPDRSAFLLRHGVALWDVIHSCEITGSSDASIRNVTVNDLHRILDQAPIQSIFVNGRKAEQLYQRYLEPQLHRTAVCLPSTSPANAAWSLDRLIDAWSAVRRTAEQTQRLEPEKTECHETGQTGSLENELTEILEKNS